MRLLHRLIGVLSVSPSESNIEVTVGSAEYVDSMSASQFDIAFVESR